jgi:F-type H+-transporting ATPase subunit c
MKKLMWLSLILICLTVFAMAQDKAETTVGKAADPTPLFLWSIIIGGMALAIAAFGGVFAQAKAVSVAVESIARNPAAADSIRTLSLIGLVLIESLVIYVLLINLILFFVKWGKYTAG